jgi:UMF1 family MFS transporter
MNKLSPSKNTFAWSWYDFANSSYVLIFQSFLLPMVFARYFSETHTSLAQWGLVNGISTFVGSIFALSVGRFSDKSIRLAIFKRLVVASFIGMILISLSVWKNQSLLPWLFIATNSLFIASTTISDSLLRFISSKNPSETTAVSGFSWGYGYIGGVTCLLIVLIIQKIFGELSPLCFIAVAIFYLVFAVISLWKLSKAGIINTETNFKRIYEVKSDFWFCIGILLITEGITVTILFYSIFTDRELGLSSSSIAITLLIIQIVAFFSTWFYGLLPSKAESEFFRNPINLLGITIFMWVALILILSVFTTKQSIWPLYVVVFMTGLVIGNSQSIVRSIFSLTTTNENVGSKFGIYAVFTQASTVGGIWLFGYLSDQLGSQRLPMIGVIVSLVVGFLIFRSNLTLNKAN